MPRAVLFEFTDSDDRCQPAVANAVATIRRVIERLGVTVTSSIACAQIPDTRSFDLDKSLGLSEADIVVVGASLDTDSTSPHLDRFITALESDERVDDDTGQRMLYGKVVTLVLCAGDSSAAIPSDPLQRLAALGATVPAGGAVIVSAQCRQEADTGYSDNAVSVLVAAHNLVWFARLLRNNPIPTNMPMIEAVVRSGKLDAVAEAIRD
ncbi:MAG: hypothetical protein AAF297_09335 [Planctomycetota bacterium]